MQSPKEEQGEIKKKASSVINAKKQRKTTEWERLEISLRKSKKRWQEYTEELYKKDLHDPDNHNSVITYLEPDILECEVKWA